MCVCVCGIEVQEVARVRHSALMKTYFSSSLHLRMRNTAPMMAPKKARAPMMPPIMAPVVGPGMMALFSSRKKTDREKKLLLNHTSFTGKHSDTFMRLICST